MSPELAQFLTTRTGEEVSVLVNRVEIFCYWTRSDLWIRPINRFAGFDGIVLAGVGADHTGVHHEAFPFDEALRHAACHNLFEQFAE